MTINTYATLKSAIADWLNRDDLTAVVPTFVSLAEAKFNREIRDYRMIARATMTLNAQYETLPPDWLETIRIVAANAVPTELRQLSLEDMAQHRAGNLDTAGPPTHFSHLGEEIEIWPTPGETTSATIVYFASIDGLEDDEDANWLLINAPDVYLYGALMQAAPYLSDDARVAVWGGLYAEGMSKMKDASEAARFGGPLRMRMRTYG